ncbi:hypothetical protein DPEC_G00168790 [Dallia pectoralis]|uniref:Uncharacterized protein n=1 Tax=Dallia pectoralis TaxID=75939 RepID=A0ACC2GCR5_DALPE|nr:hypothetical protein DPEC_G00168790 [Dallia pectoralis]
MNSLNPPPTAKEKDVYWTEKQGLWLNIVVKEEDEEKDVTVTGDNKVFRVKDEDHAVYRAEEEISVTLKEDDEYMEDLINIRETPEEADLSEQARKHHCSH